MENGSLLRRKINQTISASKAGSRFDPSLEFLPTSDSCLRRSPVGRGTAARSCKQGSTSASRKLRTCALPYCQSRPSLLFRVPKCERGNIAAPSRRLTSVLAGHINAASGHRQSQSGEGIARAEMPAHFRQPKPTSSSINRSLLFRSASVSPMTRLTPRLRRYACRPCHRAAVQVCCHSSRRIGGKKAS